MFASVSIILSLLLSSLITAQNLYEPPDGKVLFGAWVDTESAASSPSGGDTPLAYNQRMNVQADVFQLSQTIPLTISQFDNSQLTVNLSMVQNTNTGNFSVYMIFIFILNSYLKLRCNPLTYCLPQQRP
jgi:hypothetical protein